MKYFLLVAGTTNPAPSYWKRYLYRGHFVRIPFATEVLERPIIPMQLSLRREGPATALGGAGPEVGGLNHHATLLSEI